MSVYFIQRGWGGPIKIGTASDPYTRLAQLQTASPNALRLIGIIPGGFELERELHARFSDTRMVGEWFHPTAELLDFIGDGILRVIVKVDGHRKYWADVTVHDLGHFGNKYWAMVRDGRMTSAEYFEWEDFYITWRERMLEHGTFGAAFEAGGFPPAEAQSDRRTA